MTETLILQTLVLYGHSIQNNSLRKSHVEYKDCYKWEAINGVRLLCGDKDLVQYVIERHEVPRCIHWLACKYGTPGTIYISLSHCSCLGLLYAIYSQVFDCFSIGA